VKEGIRDAARSLMSMQDIFFNTKIDMRTRKQLLYSIEHCFTGIRLFGFETVSSRQAHNISPQMSTWWFFKSRRQTRSLLSSIDQSIDCADSSIARSVDCSLM
jgi:hypothetical protein